MQPHQAADDEHALQPVEYSRDRDDEHAASDWNADAGDFVRRPKPAPSRRKAAEAWVTQMLAEKGLQVRRTA